MTDNVFNETPQPTVDQFVGEGKKFKSVEDFVRGYAAAQEHINKIENENEGMRQELDTRLSVEDQIKALQTRSQVVTPEAPNPPAGTQTQTPSVEELVAKVREAESAERKQQQVQSNVEEVTQRLVDVFGSAEKANEVVRLKAQALGVSVAFLQSIAAQSPKAFYAQLDLDSQPQAQATASRPDVNANALGATNRVKPGSKEYFDEIRRNDPKRYWAKDTQNQIFEARKAGLYIVPDA